jgi:hypothetical protein
VKWEKIHRPSGLNNVWDSHPEWLFHLSDGTCRKSWNHQPNETSRSFLSVLTISYNIIPYLAPRKSNVSRASHTPSPGRPRDHEQLQPWDHFRSRRYPSILTSASP